MNLKRDPNSFKILIFIMVMLFSNHAKSQLNRMVFHEDFEKTLPNIQAIWTPIGSYTLDNASFSGKGFFFNSLNSNFNRLGIYI